MTQQAVSKAVKKGATQHPLVQMTPEERAGVALGMMQAITKELWGEIADARARNAKDELRSLLGISSLHAQRVSRVLLDQADTQVNVVQINEATKNSLAPLAADSYEQWLASGGPSALPLTPQGSSTVAAPVDVMASSTPVDKTGTQGPDVPV